MESLEKERQVLIELLSKSPDYKRALASGEDIATFIRKPNNGVPKYIKKTIMRLSDIELTIQRLRRRYRNDRANVFTESGMMDVGEINKSKESVFQNVTDVGGEEKHEVSGGDSVFPSTGQMAPLSIQEFFARPVEIAGGPIDPASALFSTHFDVWDLYSLNPTVRAKLRNYAYFSATLHIRFVVSGTPFHQGKFLLSYQPYDTSNQPLSTLLSSTLSFPDMRPLLLNYLSQSLGAKVVDVKMNTPTDMVIPFISTKPMFRLFNTSDSVVSDSTSFDDFENAGALYVYSINPLESVSTSPTFIYYKIYAWATDVKLGTSTGTQIEIQTEAGRNEFDTGPVERFATTALRVSKFAESIPGISMLAKASSIVLGGVKSLSALFGWSKPPVITPPIFVKNNPYQNGALTLGSDSVNRLVLDPKQELTIDPRVTGIDHDDMVLNAISSRPSYLTSFEWTENDAVMTPIWLSRVTPFLGTYAVGSSVWVQPTALMFVAQPFLAWRGTITFRIEVVCSLFHRGKIAVFYEPNISQATLINSSLTLNKQFMKIIDLQESQTFEIDVNWANPRAWAPCPALEEVYNTYGDDFTVGAPARTNGFIGIMPFTKLQSPISTVPVYVNIYVYSKDLRVNYITSAEMPTQRVIRTESGLMGSATAEDNVTGVDLNQSTASGDDISLYHFGEEPVSFRSLLKRYMTTTNFTTGVSGSSATFGNILINDNVFPRANVNFGDTTTTNTINLWGYLRYAYMAYRGGIRKRIRLYGVYTVDQNDTAIVSNVSPTSSELSSITYSTTLRNLDIIGSTVFVPHSNGGIEFEVPFYSWNLWNFSFNSDVMGDDNPDEVVTFFSRRFIAYISTRGDYNVQAYVDSASGEDFSFMRFQGAPWFSMATPV